MLFKGDRVYKNAFLYQVNLYDTESALVSRVLTYLLPTLPSSNTYLLPTYELRKKRVCVSTVYFYREWRSSLVNVYFFCCYSTAPCVGIVFSPSCFTKLNLAVTKNHRRTFVFGEDY